MLKTYKTTFKASKETINQLFEMNRQSALVWNECLALAKAHYQTSGKWLTKSELQRLTKQRFPLHSQSIQAVVHKYCFARDAMAKARKAGLKHLRYPYKPKRFFNTKWAAQGFRVLPGGVLLLSPGIQNGKRLVPLRLKVKQLPTNIKEVELIYDRGLKLCLNYEDGISPRDNKDSETTAIDMGEIHAITAVSTRQHGIILTGRKLRSLHRLRNKKLAELQRLMSHCKKHSRQWKKYNKAKQFVLSKSEAQLKDALHKITRNFVQWAVAEHTKTVVIGDPEGVQRHTRKAPNKRKRRSRKVAQKLNQWLFGRTASYLQYKLAAQGITFKQVSEAYTSQTCPVCGKRHKTASRNYVCPCGFREHRDILGASNILTKELYGSFQYLGPVAMQGKRVA